jgi:hypothetical protein
VICGVLDQSSAARLSGHRSFSRFCSFIGSLSRYPCGPAPHLPPHPRLFSMMVKTGSEVCKVSAEVCEVSVVMAAEERHKSPSKLGRAGEERQKVPLGVALGVCSIGSESLTLPVTLVKVPWKGAFSLAEAERAELELLGLHSWSLNAFRVFRQITPQSPTQHIICITAFRSTRRIPPGEKSHFSSSPLFPDIITLASGTRSSPGFKGAAVRAKQRSPRETSARRHTPRWRPQRPRPWSRS